MMSAAVWPRARSGNLHAQAEHIADRLYYRHGEQAVDVREPGGRY